MINGEPIKLNLKKLTIKEKNQFAEDFSEGSKELKNLLLKMWDNGIETIACCAGHENGTGKLKILSPYISFYIDNFNNENLKRIVSEIIDGCSKGVIGLSFSIRNDRKASICVRTYDLELMKSFFPFMDNMIFNEKDTSTTKLSKENVDLLETILELFKLSLKEYFNPKKSPAHQYSNVSIRTIGPSNKIYLSTCDNCAYKQINNKAMLVRLSEGYYTSIGDGKYYTLKSNKVLKLKKEELKGYKQLKEYKKYNSSRELNINELKSIINEIKRSL